eukprot:jgi/Ulvmu1/12800/UM097_0029.1
MSGMVSSYHVVRLHAVSGTLQQRPAATRIGAPACKRPSLARASDRPVQRSGQTRVVEETRTYDESEGKLYGKAAPPEDDEGSIALLVPGGRVSDRPSQAGGAAAAARRERNRPLKINTDLRLYRARQKGVQARMLASGEEKLRKAQQVEQDLRDILARDPTDERTYVTLGTLLLRQRRVTEARAVYEEGCAVAEGTNAFIWVAMANLERKEANYAPARKFFQAAITANAKHSAAYHGWGELEKRAGRFDAARNVLLQGVRQTKDDPSPYLYVSLANLAIRTDLVGEARYWLRAGTNTPRGAKSNALWTTWGNLEWKQAGDPVAAAYCFDMALRVYGASRYAHLSYAMMEKATGNLRHARDLLKAGARMNPTDAPLRQAYGVMLAEDREFAAARAQFRAAASADEYHLPVWQAWAVMEAKLRNYDRARRLFQRGVWAAPKDPNLVWLWQAWGCMEAELGNLAQARGLFKAGVGLAPDSDACWEAWIKMEEDADLLSRANALRAHRFEASQRNALPESFSTLPSDGGAVIGTVKKWMQRFMQNEGPSTVYTPPPGRLQADPASKKAGSGSPGSGTTSVADSAAPAQTADEKVRRRRRTQNLAVESAEPQATQAAAGGFLPSEPALTSSAADATSAPVAAAAAARGNGNGAGNGAATGEAGAGAPRPQGSDAGGGEAAQEASGGQPNGVNGVAGGGAQGEAEEGKLRQPTRRGTKAISGRITRPRWRRPAEGDGSGSGARGGYGGWTGQWGEPGDAGVGAAQELNMPEVKLAVGGGDAVDGVHGIADAASGNISPGAEKRSRQREERSGQREVQDSKVVARAAAAAAAEPPAAQGKRWEMQQCGGSAAAARYG